MALHTRLFENQFQTDWYTYTVKFEKAADGNINCFKVKRKFMAQCRRFCTFLLILI